MTETENILIWWEESPTRQEIISINAMEKKIEVSRGTIQHFLKRRRALPEHHLINLVRILILIGYTPISTDYQFL
jgi:hypothetical protein